MRAAGWLLVALVAGGCAGRTGAIDPMGPSARGAAPEAPADAEALPAEQPPHAAAVAPEPAAALAPAPADARRPAHVRAPAHARVQLGRSVEGRPIVLEEFGTGDRGLLVFGGIHGDELGSAYVARALAERLRDSPGLLGPLRVGVLAQANPDGLRAGTRLNANRVDLNRNFPAKNWRAHAKGRHGAAPASEPETRAIMAAVERLAPVCVVSIHAIRGRRQCNNFDGPAGALAEAMSRYNGYPVKPTIGYPTPGSFGSWCGGDRAIPTITLELPKSRANEDCWADNREALLELIRMLAAGDWQPDAPQARPVAAASRGEADERGGRTSAAGR